MLDELEPQSWGWDEPNPDEIYEEPPPPAPKIPNAPPPPPAKNRREIHFGWEALEPQPPIEWIIDGLISAGSVSLFVGEPGCKKTWSLLDMGVCTALGENWLDFSVKQCPVLIIDEESGDSRLKRRLGNVLRGHNAVPTTPVYYTTLGGFDLGKVRDVAEIRDNVFLTGAKLVIIDALVDVMMGRDENAAQFTQPIMHALRSIADETQAAIVVIHHSGKAGGYRGSSAIKGAVDQMLMVESEPDKDLVTFKSDKARDTKHSAFSADAHFEQDKFYMTASSAIPQSSRLSPAQEFVIRYLFVNGEQEIDTITGAADVCSPGSARKAIYTLSKSNMGYLKRTNPGGSGRVAVYDLTKKGEDYAQNIP